MRRDLADVGRLAIETTAPRVLQRPARRRQRRGFVEINRDREAAPNFGSSGMRDPDAVLERRTRERHERLHVGGSHARVNAHVRAKINQFRRLCDTQERGFQDRAGLPRERDHAAVVIRVGFKPQQRDAAGALDGPRDGRHYAGVAAFGKIRNALDHAYHDQRIRS